MATYANTASSGPTAAAELADQTGEGRRVRDVGGTRFDAATLLPNGVDRRAEPLGVDINRQRSTRSTPPGAPSLDRYRCRRP